MLGQCQRLVLTLITLKLGFASTLLPKQILNAKNVWKDSTNQLDLSTFIQSASISDSALNSNVIYSKACVWLAHGRTGCASADLRPVLKRAQRDLLIGMTLNTMGAVVRKLRQETVSISYNSLLQSTPSPLPPLPPSQHSDHGKLVDLTARPPR